jgi:hypothetical protein
VRTGPVVSRSVVIQAHVQPTDAATTNAFSVRFDVSPLPASPVPQGSAAGPEAGSRPGVLTASAPAGGPDDLARALAAMMPSGVDLCEAFFNREIREVLNRT